MIQPFGTVRKPPIGPSYEARMYACQRLNHLLADTRMLYALYKKHHWLMRDATFHQLHLLLDRHAAENTSVPRPPDGVEEVPAMLSRLLEAHETILVSARDAAHRLAELGDDGSNDLIVSEVVRGGEAQAWFLAEHLVETPLVRLLPDTEPQAAEAAPIRA